MKTIAIIPARGGSKGIPRKNISLLAGKPLLVRNIEAAQKSFLVNDVLVSTDDTEIATVAINSGALVINRPPHLSNDFSGSEGVLLHALEELHKNNKMYDLIVFMQCTSPLTTADDIDTAIQKLIDEKADSCVTVTDFHYFIWQENKDGTACAVNHDQRVRIRRQDQEPQYIENGAVYVMNIAGFLDAKHRFFGKTVLSVMPPERSVEIDTPVDLKIAEAMIVYNKHKLNTKLPDQIKAVLLDFDGVFTNNNVYLSEDGLESVCCNRSDGWGISQLKKMGIKIAVLSTENNPVVSLRCQKLGIECHQGLGNTKLKEFTKWCSKNKIAPDRTIFVGNDTNDIECIRAAGCGIAPADSHPDIIQAADLILTRNGGDACIRELCDMIQERELNI